MRIVKFYALLSLAAGLLFLNACEGILNEEDLENGKFTFWSNFDGPPIEIYIGNDLYGTITEFYPSSPGCDASGCVTIALPAGEYEFYAVEKPIDGSTPKSWEDTRIIEANVCITIGLTP